MYRLPALCACHVVAPALSAVSGPSACTRQTAPPYLSDRPLSQDFSPHTTFSEREKMTREGQTHMWECEHTVSYSNLGAKQQRLVCSVFGTGAVELTVALALEGGQYSIGELAKSCPVSYPVTCHACQP